jgi:fatty acid desaturase
MESKAVPAATKRQSAAHLPLGDMKKIVADLFAVNPWIYWLDFLGSAGVFWVCFYLTEQAPALSAAELLYFTVSVFALYRASLFIHELTHQERRTLPGFSVAWNLLIGVPMLVPSFMYRGVHIDHHRKSMYGTDEDGEYLPFGASPLWRSLLYLGQTILLPFLLVFRFGILVPVSLLHPKIRHFVMTHTSSFAIRTDTARRIPTDPTELRNWYILETLALAWVLTLFVLLLEGIMPLGTLRHLYLLMIAVFFVNSVRTLVAHRYRNRTAHEMSFAEQYEDSVNVIGPWGVMELVAPVGLRFHALHHLFPSMPYHNLGIAHRRLVKELPADSIYHVANEPNLLTALVSHWRNTRRAGQEEDALARGASRI